MTASLYHLRAECQHNTVHMATHNHAFALAHSHDSLDVNVPVHVLFLNPTIMGDT
jgi:hypothetical protein